MIFIALPYFQRKILGSNFYKKNKISEKVAVDLPNQFYNDT